MRSAQLLSLAVDHDPDRPFAKCPTRIVLDRDKVDDCFVNVVTDLAPTLLGNRVRAFSKEP
jgi:hypothetical protein